MDIFGEKLNKNDLLRKIGDISQICDVRSFEYNDGVSKGVRAVSINNSISGIDMTVLMDRGMDISSLSYKSFPLCFKSKVKETSPIFYESSGTEFLRTFHAGFLLTAGLLNTGWPCEDNGESFGLHDRISNTHAEKIFTDLDWESENIFIEGKVRETKWFGDYLELSRRIGISLDKPVINIEDCVENIGYRESPLMILYHLNLGFPLLNSSSRLFIGKASTIADDENSEKYIEEFDKFTNPIDDAKYNLFYHDVSEDSNGNCNIVFSNPAFNKEEGIGLWIKYKKNELPCLTQMKNMFPGEYICCIEPGSNFVRGRETEKKDGKLRILKPGEKANFKIEIKVLGSNKEITSLLDSLGYTK